MTHKQWAILLISLAFAACHEMPPPKVVPPLGSRVELAAGDVWLASEAGKQRIVSGAMLPEEARLSAAAGARALVRLGTGTGAFVRGGSEIAISGPDVRLESGEMWVEVPSDDRDLGRVTAGSVTVAASGAGLDVALDGNEVRVYVARGLAVVSSPSGRAEVQCGERAVVKGDGAPSVSPVSFWEDWTGGMADREIMAGVGGKASGRIYGIDRSRPGSPPEELQILSQQVRAIVHEGIAHTTVDQRFFNPSGVDLEGWYWFTIPEGAAVERFAIEVNGALVDGEMTERKQAAEAYEEAIQRAFDPALLEWVDGRTFRARIYPIPATGERRVVLSYTQLLPLSDGAYRYVYPMGGEGEKRIQEFSLEVLLGEAGKGFEIATLQDARVSDDSSVVSMRRSGFVPRSDFLLELTPIEPIDPMRIARYSTGLAEADYVMLRYAPEVAWAEVEDVPGDVVVVVDTSAGGGQSERQIRADVTEAVLRALSAGDRFAVVATDLAPKVVYPAEGLAEADEESISAATEDLSEIASAGATDLGEMFSVALDLVHEAEQPAVLYVGDGRATVGEIGSDELAERLRRSLGESRARLFTIAVGEDANLALLERLARIGGGRAFRVDTPDQTVQEALRFAGMVKTPTITDLAIDAGAGLDQVFSTATGKVSEGQEVVLVARTHHDLPDRIGVTGRLAGKPFERTYQTEVETGPDHGYLPSLWAREYVERLMGEGADENRGTVISLGLTYALMTPFTSFLVLESDWAYAQQGIPRRERSHLWGARGAAELERAVSSPSSPGVDAKARFSEYEEDYYDEATLEGEVAMPSPAEPAPAPSMDAEWYGGPAAGAVSSISEETAKDGSARQSYRRPAKRKKAEKAPPPAPAPDTATRGAGGGGRLSGNLGGLGTSGPAGRDLDDLVIHSGVSRGGEGRAAASGALFEKGVCSDASRRPLAQRRILWQARLSRTSNAAERVRVFYEAGEQCELPGWKDRRSLLDLIERRSRTPSDVQMLLAGFEGREKIQRFLRQRILRRTLDPDLTMGLYFPTGVDWYTVRQGLVALEKPSERVAKIEKILEKHPDDPAGRALLVEALLDADRPGDARAVASRLRRDEFAGPLVLETLCDLQSEAGLEREAKRTCSELVEFNSDDPAARRALGDLFLRHGWYEAAYRQYRTLVDISGDDPLSLLRLAAAAAGMGKTDEALRIERRVAGGEGEPGPGDPRRWARLHSAIRLAGMILDARAAGDDDRAEALERSLKRTQVFAEPATLVLLSWEDYEVPIELAVEAGEDAYPVSDRVDSQETGLVAIDLGKAPSDEVTLALKVDGPPVRRAVGLSLVEISWDGEEFTIERADGTLAPRATEIALRRP